MSCLCIKINKIPDTARLSESSGLDGKNVNKPWFKTDVIKLLIICYYSGLSIIGKFLFLNKLIFYWDCRQKTKLIINLFNQQSPDSIISRSKIYKVSYTCGCFFF